MSSSTCLVLFLIIGSTSAGAVGRTRDQIKGCCNKLEVVQGQEAITGAKDAQSKIFTTYQIEENPLNGRVHYTSIDGKRAIAWNNEDKAWHIGHAESRY